MACVWPQINQPKGLDGLPEIRKAFEFTVEKMGADMASGPLWQEYVAFLEVRQVWNQVHVTQTGCSSTQHNAL